MVAHSLEATAVNRKLCLESALQYLLYVSKKYAIKNFRNIQKIIKCNCTKKSAFQLQIKHALGGSKQIIVLAPLEKFIIYSWHENDTPRPHFSNLKNKGFQKKVKRYNFRSFKIASPMGGFGDVQTLC